MTGASVRKQLAVQAVGYPVSMDWKRGGECGECEARTGNIHEASRPAWQAPFSFASQDGT